MSGERRYTLITSIGKGMYTKTGYNEVEYMFRDGRKATKRLFVEALLAVKYRPFSEIIFIGTRTSSWHVLVNEQDSTLWKELKAACDGGEGITDGQRGALEKYVSEKYHIPVRIKVHTPVVDQDTLKDIFPVYVDLYSELAPGTDVLFDVTHGFRSMPIFIYQALLSGAVGKNEDRRIELVYGELDDSKTKGTVRDLSEYWDYSRQAAAKNMFYNRLDGTVLAEYLEPVWPDAAHWIKRFSLIVRNNFSLQIKNELAGKPDSLEAVLYGKKWKEETDLVKFTYGFLMELFTEIYDQAFEQELVKFSRFLKEKSLSTQAVIAVEIAVEVKVVRTIGSDEDVCCWDKWKGKQNSGTIHTYSDWYYDLHNWHLHPEFPPEYKVFVEIGRIRNEIAHGGGEQALSVQTYDFNHLNQVYDNAYGRIRDYFDYITKWAETHPYTA